MNRTEQFLEKYKELENAAIGLYGFAEDGKAIANLTEMPEFRNIRMELSYCREVRNLLQHRVRLGSEYAVEPSEAMIQLLGDTVEKVKNPLRCRDIAIPCSKLLCSRPEAFVLPAMKEMRRRGFTHLPIIEGGKVAGIFSESRVFFYCTDHEAVGIPQDLRFEDIRSYLSFDLHHSEIYAWMPWDAFVSEAESLYEDAYMKGKRLGMYFLTQNGKPEEKLLGIVTPNDILGN